MPGSLAGAAMGVIGLTNTQRNAKNVKHVPHFNNTMRPGAKASSTTNCETSYPTVQQLFSHRVDGNPLVLGYGAGPGCSGLTPSQENSLYDAPNLGSRVKGKGVDIAVFELSAYLHSDIATWAHQFYGPHYTPPLVDVNIDGGPLNPECPSGDQCPPQFEGYSGDIEVDADIENQLAVAPDVKALTVYNAPNDFTGQTELDEWSAIAKANAADAVSSSWAVCEQDITATYAQAENTIFRQMAAQGQAVFGGDGDTGAFGCIRSDGTTILNLIDPPSQPWVTAVGGTSFENFNPGTNPPPRYPRAGEAVWNPQNLCNSAPPSPANDNQGGFFWCAADGAGGGGGSQFWGMPSYQKGPGVINPGTTFGNGTTQCSLAKNGTPCREVPDISADADEYTPYSEFCTGSDATPNSVCATFSGSQPVPGWFGIGGFGHHRRPGQLPREPQRQHQPDAVPGLPDRAVGLLPRRHRRRPLRQEQRPVPDGARIRPRHGHRHDKDRPAHHQSLLSKVPPTAGTGPPSPPSACLPRPHHLRPPSSITLSDVFLLELTGRRPMTRDSIRGSSDRSILILTSLADWPKHGYALIKDIEDFAGVKLGAGTLYSALAKLEQSGLVEALPAEERRRPYRITPAGREYLYQRLTESARIAEVGLRRIAVATP